MLNLIESHNRILFLFLILEKEQREYEGHTFYGMLQKYQ